MATYTTTAHGIRWLPGGNLASDIDAGFQALAEDVDANLLTTVTSLPGSPVDGQRCLYLADATNGIVWDLRYRSASASTYKWEFIGGGALSDEVLAGESVSSTSYTDLATVGPSVTVPRAGIYEVSFGCMINTGTTGLTFSADIKVGATAEDSNDRVECTTSGAGGDIYSLSRVLPRRTIATAATAVVLRYKINPGTSSTVSKRFLTIRPVRVI